MLLSPSQAKTATEDQISAYLMVVDDEEISREYVVKLVNQDKRFSVVGASSDGLQAVEDFERFRPSAVFIDLEMPGLHGFEFCQKINVSTTSVVFVTAHGPLFFYPREIQFIDSSGNYVKIWIRNKPHLVRDTFQRFCESLPCSEITIVPRRYAVDASLNSNVKLIYVVE